MRIASSEIPFDIIVAEDEPITRRRLTGMLTSLGHPVRAFANGRAAWESFNESPVRVVISDWQMPEMEGTELCRLVRARQHTEYTYFILITGERTEVRDYDSAISAGTDDFLTKPISRDSIWRRLRVARRILGFTKHIRQLEQLIPMCAYCKNIREDEDHWRSIEEYIQSHTDSRFTHGICPDCYGRVVQALDAMPV
jgi:sigma-B regulation protein RsbU (phosphoserine phosphatase)